jgi:hypothetical protein
MAFETLDFYDVLWRGQGLNWLLLPDDPEQPWFVSSTRRQRQVSSLTGQKPVDTSAQQKKDRPQSSAKPIVWRPVPLNLWPVCWQERLAALGEAADGFARPINDAVTKGIKYLLDEQKLGGAELLAGGAAVSLAGFGAAKLAGRGLMSVGQKAVGGVLSGMGGLGAVKLPMPVYVVNRHMSLTRDAMMGGGGGGRAAGARGVAGNVGAAAAASGTRGLSLLTRASNVLGRLAGPVALATAALTAGAALMDESLTTAQKIEATAGAAGQGIGGLAGAVTGAAIGSVVPIVGTAVGGIIGGILGSLGGGALGEKAAQYFNTVSVPTQQELIDRVRELQERGALDSEVLVKVQVDGGTATVTQHKGPAQVDVYSGVGYNQLNAPVP